MVKDNDTHFIQALTFFLRVTLSSALLHCFLHSYSPECQSFLNSILLPKFWSSSSQLYSNLALLTFSGNCFLFLLSTCPNYYWSTGIRFLARTGIGHFRRDWTGTGVNILYLNICGAIDSILMLQVFDSYVKYLNIIYLSQFECLLSFVILRVNQRTATQLSIIVCYRSMNIARTKCCYTITFYRVAN